jgi:flagellar basal body L-ring protein FlgH
MKKFGFFLCLFFSIAAQEPVQESSTMSEEENHQIRRYFDETLLEYESLLGSEEEQGLLDGTKATNSNSLLYIQIEKMRNEAKFKNFAKIQKYSKILDFFVEQIKRCMTKFTGQNSRKIRLMEQSEKSPYQSPIIIDKAIEYFADLKE